MKIIHRFQRLRGGIPRQNLLFYARDGVTDSIGVSIKRYTASLPSLVVVPTYPSDPATKTIYYVKPSATYPGGGTAPYDTPEKASDIRTVFTYARANTATAAVIRLAAGTYDLSVPNWVYYSWGVAYDLMIEGHDGTGPLDADQAIIDGKGTHSFLSIDNAACNLVLRNHAVINCVNQATLTNLSACRVQAGASVFFDSVNYSGNSNTGVVPYGAALHANSVGGNIIALNSIFDSNATGNLTTGNGYGGAWYLGTVGGSVIVDGAVFSNNTSTIRGGAIYATSGVVGNVVSIDTTFSGNIAEQLDFDTGSGGAFFISEIGGDVNLRDTSFVNNSARKLGGAISIQSGFSGTFLDGSDCYYNGNSVDDGADTAVGGAIYVGGISGDAYFRGHYSGNTAPREGGALWCGGLGLNVVAGATIHDNHVNGVLYDGITHQGGGFIFSGVGVTATVEDSVFSDNSVPSVNDAGGALKFSNGASGVVRRNTFFGNSGNQGGAIDFGGSFAVTSYLSFNTFYNNTATGETYGWGGAWDSLAAHAVDANNNTYVNNTTEGTGAYAASTINPGGNTTLRNEIVRGAVTKHIQGAEAQTLDMQYCNIQGGADVVFEADTYANNIDSDPLFTDAANGDFTLQASSPCNRTGTSSALTGTDDLYDAAGYQIYDGTYQLPDGHFIDGVDIGSYAHGSASKFFPALRKIGDVWIWDSAPHILDITGGNNAVYNLDGTGKDFATQALAIAAMESLANDTTIFAGRRGIAMYSVDSSAIADRINRALGN